MKELSKESGPTEAELLLFNGLHIAHAVIFDEGSLVEALEQVQKELLCGISVAVFISSKENSLKFSIYLPQSIKRKCLLMNFLSTHLAKFSFK